jgi:hypothetical protein
LHDINAIIVYLFETNNKNVAIGSFIARTYNDSTPQRRRVTERYRDPFSLWDHGTEGFEYGIKPHVSQDMDSTAIID